MKAQDYKIIGKALRNSLAHLRAVDRGLTGYQIDKLMVELVWVFGVDNPRFSSEKFDELVRG